MTAQQQRTQVCFFHTGILFARHRKNRQRKKALSKKFDWARSQNGYFDKFIEDMRHQIVIIIDKLHNYAI